MIKTQTERTACNKCSDLLMMDLKHEFPRQWPVNFNI
ncbi:hypothetical protein Mal48_44540 [Thalassoglobus polymorphus]|uniref:Uncharacterized protein n=1 Tax=Thalassoglobus polymorphus TaxID=2527994 RepID=A0A517QU98_9PLAN|nr:hypothetical protein Mal48_44540 [Thalassoglobus polymorphus]